MKKLIYFIAVALPPILTATCLWSQEPPQARPTAAPVVAEETNRPPAVISLPVGSTGTVLMSNTITSATFTSSGTYMTTTHANGTMTLASTTNFVAVPHFHFECKDDSCTARAVGMTVDEARGVLEKIAQRRVKVDIVVDENCVTRRDSIPAREPEVAMVDR